MVEHAAVNRVVVGSSPTSGANLKILNFHHQPSGHKQFALLSDSEVREPEHYETPKISLAGVGPCRKVADDDIRLIVFGGGK